MKRFDYATMNLVPRKCIVNSRSECSTKCNLGKHTFQMPVVPANMECIINDELAIRLASNNCFYIHHRFQTDSVTFARRMRALNLPISISVGVNEDDYALLTNLKSLNLIPDYVTIDIAHGHAVKMEAMLRWIRREFGDARPFLIAGNVSTPEAVRDLEAWGADAIKVGIGPGSACTTYVATGFGSRNIQAAVVQACVAARCLPTTHIIADGGIKEPGDIAKSLVLGATMVMIGGFFSGCTDSPGKAILGTDGHMYKEFWGSASASTKGKTNRIEGMKTLTRSKQKTLLEEMAVLEESLQSAISYGGGRDLSCFASVEFV
jgi:GMP reductase